MTRQVPFVDLRRQHQPIEGELTLAFQRVVSASGFVLSDEVALFEAEFADYCGTRYCVGVASGTAALALALLAAGIGPGDEVIVPAHTFIASALGVLHAGAKPVLCDVQDGNGLLDVESAASAITESTAAILPVHLYGQTCDMDAITELADRHGIAVIEDAAQAHGATYRGRRAGSFGLAAGFSFYPSKNLGALGDGGAICTDDEQLAERARMLRHLGQRLKGAHEVTGFNERLDGIQAAFLRVKLPHLDAWNAARQRHAATYRAALNGSLAMPDDDPEAPSIYHVFPVRTSERDALAQRLAGAGIDTGIHYAPSLDRQPALAAHLSPNGEYPVATAWASEQLSLPMFESLRADEIEHVASACGA